MRAVVTRVTSASVTVGAEVTGAIDRGLLVLVAVGHEDTTEDAAALARKIAGLRIFADAEGAMNLDLAEVRGEILAVSQFTLFGDVRKGRRPSFVAAAPSELGRELLDRFVADLRGLGVHVETGRFGADMQVASVNSVPITILIDTKRVF